MHAGALRSAVASRYPALVVAGTVLCVLGLFVWLLPAAGGGTLHGLDDRALVAFVLAVTLAGIVKGMTGFGYGTIAAPVAASLVEPRVAFIVLTIPALMVNVFQIGETGIAMAFVREEWVTILAALVGSVLGVAALGAFGAGPALPFLLGVLLLGYVAYEVTHGFAEIGGAGRPSLRAAASLSHGFTFGAFNLGPILPAYLHTYERDLDRYIGGLALITGIVLVEKAVLLVATGLLTPYLAWLGAAVALVTLVGIAAGSLLRRVVPPSLVHRGIVALLFVVALNLLREAWALQ